MFILPSNAHVLPMLDQCTIAVLVCQLCRGNFRDLHTSNIRICTPGPDVLQSSIFRDAERRTHFFSIWILTSEAVRPSDDPITYWSPDACLHYMELSNNPQCGTVQGAAAQPCICYRILTPVSFSAVLPQVGACPLFLLPRHHNHTRITSLRRHSSSSLGRRLLFRQRTPL